MLCRLVRLILERRFRGNTIYTTSKYKKAGGENDEDQMPPVTGTAGCNHTLGALVNTDQRSKFLPSQSFPPYIVILSYTGIK